MSEQPLSEQFELDARFDQPFLVLTLAAGAIATLGLLANSSAVVIGAMLIAPWMLPLRAAAFGILQGRLLLAGRALFTLLIGIALTVVLSVLLGASVGLPILGSEVAARTQPNLLDLVATEVMAKRTAGEANLLAAAGDQQGRIQLGPAFGGMEERWGHCRALAMRTPVLAGRGGVCLFGPGRS